MCSEYQTKTSPKEIEEALGVPILNHAAEFEWGSKMNFFKNGPVLQKRASGELELVLKSFPTSPMPNSRISGLEGQSDGGDEEKSDDRQIKRIYEMALWKDGFKSHPLLIPMSEFTEFAYWGKEKGTAQGFKIPNEKVLFAAGIAIKPFKPNGPVFSGYSILTHTATPQMFEYHQRLIVLFEKRIALEYLEEMSPKERFDFTIANRYTGELEVEKIRSMAKGWEKRIDLQSLKNQRELTYRKVLEKEGVEG